MTRVFVISRSPALRAGLRAMLAEQLSIELIGEAARLDDLSIPVAALTDADVLVFASSEDLPRGTSALLPQRGIVLLANDERAVAQMRAVATGGWGLLAPEADAEELQLVVNAVARGMTILPQPLAAKLLPPISEADANAQALEIDLTPREQDVLDWLGRGLPNKLIAQELRITEATVKFHVSAVYAKLGAASRAEAITKAARLGLITL